MSCTELQQPSAADSCTARQSSLFLRPYRPWMTLLNVRVKHGAAAMEREGELSLIEKMLPEELLLSIFQRVPITCLAAAQLVCRQWRDIAATPLLWRKACQEAFFTSTMDQNAALVKQRYGNSWKRMLLERSHLRFDGIYVSRNTYLRQGIVEWRVKNAVHLVLYFRYIRFFPDGTFSYRTSPEPLSKVFRSLAAPPPAARQQQQQQQRRLGGGSKDLELVQHGRFKHEDQRVWTALRYHPRSPTEVRSRLRLRSTAPGANNRLDIEAIVSWDREEGQGVPMIDLQPDEEAAEGAEQQQHQRGMCTYVFVPFEQVHTHILNLPVRDMDVFISG